MVLSQKVGVKKKYVGFDLYDESNMSKKIASTKTEYDVLQVAKATAVAMGMDLGDYVTMALKDANVKHNNALQRFARGLPHRPEDILKELTVKNGE